MNILILEDDIDTQPRLKELVQSSGLFARIEACDSIKQASKTIKKLNIDIALVDLGLTDGFGGDFIAMCYNKYPQTQCVVLSGFQDHSSVFKALEAGAKGYILKHDPHQDILLALTNILEGGAPISPSIARMVLNRCLPPKQAQQEQKLTDKQLNILKLISQGFTSKEIAQKTQTSYHTVTTHIKNIYALLQVNNRTQALHEAHALHLL